MVRYGRSLMSGSERSYRGGSYRGSSYRGCSSWVLSDKRWGSAGVVEVGREGTLTCGTSMGSNQDWGQTRRNHSSQQGRITPTPGKGWVHVTRSACCILCSVPNRLLGVGHPSVFIPTLGGGNYCYSLFPRLPPSNTEH